MAAKREIGLVELNLLCLHMCLHWNLEFGICCIRCKKFEKKSQKQNNGANKIYECINVWYVLFGKVNFIALMPLFLIVSGNKKELIC